MKPRAAASRSSKPACIRTRRHPSITAIRTPERRSWAARHVAPRSSYFILPLFALANAGVVMSAAVMSGREPLMAAMADASGMSESGPT